MTRDGTTLTASVVIPSGSGRHPLAVIPAPWGFAETTFESQAADLSRRGYVVITYNTRGFYSSGGTVDLAGPQDVSDVSDVITWALAHTPADPTRIAAAGLSYGAGIALLAAGADPRIGAVASLSGWTDFGLSLYAANTRHKAAVNLLTTLQSLTGRRGDEVSELLDDYRAFRNMPQVLDWARPRGVASDLDALNRRRPAIFMAAAYGDNFFSPVPQIGFFNQLTGPKALRLAPGDHGTNEIGGLLGFPNALWSSAWDWFDRYLRPDSLAARAPAPAAVQLTTDGGAIETYSDWDAVTRSRATLRLGPAWAGTGSLSATAATGTWSTTIRSGQDTTANAGTILITRALQEITHLPPLLDLATVDRRDGAVWQTGPNPATQRIRGVPTLHLTLTPNVDSGTVVAYLYDTGPTDVATIISKAVYSYYEATPGRPLATTLTFDPVARDVPFGHHLSLVVDTKDDLYYDLDRSEGTVAFGSPAADPSVLTVPLG
ncbi:alpha/beta fold hydrolase [Frankia sp. R82]|uniref:alpha/beta fold hydrolase n=1 Tax=Frankia sp. R82 TaxID=2950553 RepID=UPI002043C4B6|nr:alpha/beta fold hydrolase [Frankia sp. R82]MCM3885332.1 prolyl oligopeptidase family serine peptidase [Frankia sp. R82]